MQFQRIWSLTNRLPCRPCAAWVRPLQTMEHVDDGIKEVLRRLYKLVHPDLFADNRTAQLENERSFKLLQEYLQLSQSSDARSPVARTVFSFTFYLRKSDESEGRLKTGERQNGGEAHVKGGNTGSMHAPEENSHEQTASRSMPSVTEGDPIGRDSCMFHKVEVSLPPPQPQPAGSKKKFSPSVRRGLAKLFTACGLPGVFSEAVGKDDHQDTSSSLSAFLPEAVEQLRLRAIDIVDPRVKLANLRGALRLGKQVLVSFPSQCDLSPQQCVQLVMRLVSVFDSCPGLDVKGCKILIGDTPTGIDRLGHLCLHHEDRDEEWREMLLQVDIKFVLNRLEYVKSVRALEMKASSSSGLTSIYTTPTHLPEPSYRSFIEGLLDHSSAHGYVAEGKFHQLSICVLPAHVRHTAQGSPLGIAIPDGVALDHELGVMHVTDDLDAACVYDAVRLWGDRALLAVKAHAAYEKENAMRLGHLRRVLHLKHLTKDPRLSARYFDQACTRLLEQADALGNVLDGSSIHIGFKTRMALDRLYIEIAWDFTE
ncbi:hypothetical protein CEUSTIGMA_g4537.t1 [Chlamydomonas eustigma]|uniref:DUF4460 domain-containing protein n=1 Tax=Chlamydomonas eustigma TaxID=1157962 RepID=A0A250X1Z3_9CHLO|nr:hypothetical protein CEUSTIGMA_g4537.t1 [Chlamydomonas eustigma]|eukprot:GAX77091.1 hypothetical protein CEUSTIGMA_g4537.t1 [Chlamydomonas eustigma]